MPEMPNVVSGETIESEWGNDIRDRTLQRYVNAADRTALHALPQDGDMAFLEDVGQTSVYYSGAWRPLTLQEDTNTLEAGLDDRFEFGAAVNNTVVTDVGTSYVAAVNDTFTKPASWTTYKMLAWGTVTFRTFKEAANPRIAIQCIIAGVTDNEVDSLAANDPDGFADTMALSTSQKRSGLTGNSVVAIQMREIDPAVSKYTATLSYLAIRQT